MDLAKQLELYIPYNQQEEKDKQVILKALNLKDIFFRTNEMCHITSSAWIVNSDFTKVLMAYHRIYDSWAWLGGHNDGNTDCLQVAIQEAKEESGLKNIVPLSDSIFSIEVLTVDGHEKKGSYVSSHLHLNITYLLQADENEEVHIKEDENKGVKWFLMEEVEKVSSEPWFIKRIYNKYDPVNQNPEPVLVSHQNFLKKILPENSAGLIHPDCQWQTYLRIFLRIQ